MSMDISNQEGDADTSNGPTGNNPEQMFGNESLDEMTREHWFYDYWKNRIVTRKTLMRSDLERMLEYKRWLAPIGDCLRIACSMDILAVPDVEWLMQQLPVDSYAWQQIAALSLLKQETITANVKLARLLDLRTDWAIIRLAEVTPAEQLVNWINIIDASHRPVRAKRRLLDRIQQQIGSNGM